MRLGVNIKEQWSKKERGAGGEDEGNYKKERGMEMESKPGRRRRRRLERHRQRTLQYMERQPSDKRGK